jgi:hypothetical protein
VTYTAHFKRWASQPDTEEYPTLDEAVTFLAYGVDGDYMAAEKVTGPDNFLLTGPELANAMWDIIDRHKKTRQ